MYGTGLVELHKYKEALGPLNEAIKTAANTPHVAYPTIAITAKIGALSGLGRYQEALQLADEEMRRVYEYHLTAHLYDLYRARALVYQQMNAWGVLAAVLMASFSGPNASLYLCSSTSPVPYMLA